MTEKGFRNRIRIFAAALACMLVLSSCKGLELENKTEQVEEYTRAQAMIFLANERNRYQNAYSAGIWDIRVDETGQTFDSMLISAVKDYLQTVKLLCMMAGERGVSVTSRERDLIRQMTDDYTAGLTAADIQYIGCSREDVQKMYTEYYTACKMAKTLISRSQTDISDSEVKVIRIMQIGTADVKKAKAILKKLKIDGADFNSMASRYSELDQIEVELKKGTAGDLIEQTAFSLEEGGISNILCENDMYYIVKCVNGYDRTATEERKKGLETALNSKAFQEELEPYRKAHNIVFFERFWDSVDFSAGEGSTVSDFFDIYENYAD